MKTKKAQKQAYYSESEEQYAKDQAELYDTDARAEAIINDERAVWEE